MLLIYRTVKKGKMKIRKEKIQPEILNGFATALSTAVPGITGSTLLKAIENFAPDENGEAKGIPPKDALVRPMTIKEAAQFLKMSVATIHRLMRKGLLRRIRLSSKLVRVDGKSIRQLLETKEAGSDESVTQQGRSNRNVTI